MAGIANLSSTVGMSPLTYTFALDTATTGLMLDFVNDSGLTCLVKLGLYFATQAGSGQYVAANIATTATVAAATLVAATQTAATGTVFWSTLVPLFYDGYHLSVWNVTSSATTGTTAASVVGYAVIQLFPVCSVT
jgi:hypothetical protein